MAACQPGPAAAPETDTAVPPAASPTATATLSPTPAPTVTAVPTNTPSTTPQPTATATATPTPTITPTAFPTAAATDDGLVYLEDQLLLDTQQEAPGCFGVGEISYAPTNDYFLVLLSCFEGDNEAFLFKADGSGRQKITGQWRFLNYNYYDWSPDGRYLVYQRINSCCATPPADAPPVGLVRYDAAAGEERFLMAGGGKPKWSPDGKWIAVLKSAYPRAYIDVISVDDGQTWRLDVQDYASPWTVSLAWEQTEQPEVLVLRVVQSDREKAYTLSRRPEDPPPGTPAPFTGEAAVYRVINVPSNDVLNARSGPGVGNPVVGVIPPDGTGIQITGESVSVGHSLWVPVRYQNVAGWVNQSFLAEE